ncbi:hypothetical protein ACH4YN_36835 [Streptomyces griseofuscus]|uniref:hypothetical protein n=1 Tax=Streptomyces griseofuscus TaxID=146922 RepID=UPI003796C6EC
MANIVWHTTLGIELDLTREDLGHEALVGLWDDLYKMDRLYAARDVPVSKRGLQCGGVCRSAGVVAWMYLRLRENGRREAVHERAEDEARHRAALSDEHKAYQERIVKTSEEAGFPADSEVRTSIGPRSWIQTDTLVQGEGGLLIGWEVQLATAGAHGPKSVRARANRAAKNGITPAWHTDRRDYARRSDTHWTRSDLLPAEVIAKSKDLRVVSGFRVLDFWRCDLHALYRCPDSQRRCGKMHATPKPRDVFFDDLVRQTAAGLIVPVEFRDGSRTHRFWVTDSDRDRYADLTSGRPVSPSPDLEDLDLGPVKEGSRRAPTCRPMLSAGSSLPPVTPPSLPGGTDAPGDSVASAVPASASVRIPRQYEEADSVAQTQPNSNAHIISGMDQTDFPDDLLAAQTRLHRALAELSALLRSLPWSVEPMDGWPGTEHPHTGEITGGREPSPGWTAEQKTAVTRLRQECLELAATVTTHPHWASFQGADAVKERMRLKHQTEPAAAVTTADLTAAA